MFLAGAFLVLFICWFGRGGPPAPPPAIAIILPPLRLPPFCFLLCFFGVTFGALSPPLAGANAAFPGFWGRIRYLIKNPFGWTLPLTADSNLRYNLSPWDRYGTGFWRPQNISVWPGTFVWNGSRSASPCLAQLGLFFAISSNWSKWSSILEPFGAVNLKRFYIFWIIGKISLVMYAMG